MTLVLLKSPLVYLRIHKGHESVSLGEIKFGIATGIESSAFWLPSGTNSRGSVVKQFKAKGL
jgi:hypothetical protein